MKVRVMVSGQTQYKPVVYLYTNYFGAPCEASLLTFHLCL